MPRKAKAAAGYGGTIDRRHEKAEQEKTARRRGPRLQGDTTEDQVALLNATVEVTGRTCGSILEEALALFVKALPVEDRKEVERRATWKRER